MVSIQKANKEDSHIVAGMVARLLSELTAKELEKATYIKTCEELFEVPDIYSCYIALDNQECVGTVAVSESCSIYAGGRFGIIQELYVLPEYRSKNIGHLLIDNIVELAKVRGWKRIEVGTPDPVIWNRTIEFYKREGFSEVGLKLKMVF
ncbi:GNAT family N-acetyltransferase [Paenibacillus sp. YYML68]|uniref:GNAT family N-acetyltransferase n=1 Tax=Paenibacillus sp. YYML68 TaxID=2909250 RepID=UPI002493161A|nr:GNAT family N-acetyltransferase [Paenibacillus sp. YYML68]